MNFFVSCHGSLSENLNLLASEEKIDSKARLCEKIKLAFYLSVLVYYF